MAYVCVFAAMFLSRDVDTLRCYATVKQQVSIRENTSTDFFCRDYYENIFNLNV